MTSTHTNEREKGRKKGRRILRIIILNYVLVTKKSANYRESDRSVCSLRLSITIYSYLFSLYSFTHLISIYLSLNLSGAAEGLVCVADVLHSIDCGDVCDDGPVSMERHPHDQYSHKPLSLRLPHVCFLHPGTVLCGETLLQRCVR